MSDSSLQFRLFLRSACVRREITLGELRNRAGVSTHLTSRPCSPNFFSLCLIVEALRSFKPFNKTELRQILSIIGAVDGVSIPSVDIMQYSSRLVWRRKRAA